MQVWVIIAAAGRSQRFGGSDKLAQDLGGRAVLLRSVELFAQRAEVTGIVVAAPPEELTSFRDRYGPTLGFHGATIVEGGRTHRWESVANALKHVPDTATHVAVHDAARPGASPRLLDRLFEAADTLDAVVPGLPLSDTVKRVGDEAIELAADEDDALAGSILGDHGKRQVPARRVVETLDRSGLVSIQTPQVFNAQLLRRAYGQDDRDGVTDDASLVERLGEPVHLVEGETRNFKITTPDDLSLMRSVLGVKAPAERPVHKRF